MEEDILDIIQKIQEIRNPKYFLWDIIKNVEWFASEKYTDYLIGKKNDIVYFNYDKKNHFLYYSYDKIYQILELKYHLNRLNANKLISGMVSEHFKLRVDTTARPHVDRARLVSEHFKLRVDTTFHHPESEQLR